jgi:hypothetical protein
VQPVLWVKAWLHLLPRQLLQEPYLKRKLLRLLDLKLLFHQEPHPHLRQRLHRQLL